MVDALETALGNESASALLVVLRERIEDLELACVGGRFAEESSDLCKEGCRTHGRREEIRVLGESVKAFGRQREGGRRRRRGLDT